MGDISHPSGLIAKGHLNNAGKEAENALVAGVSEYLNDNNEVLHTQSCQWLMDEIDERLKMQV